MVVNEVANKFAGSHFQRGVREKIVRLLIKIIIDYVQVNAYHLGSINIFPYGLIKDTGFLTHQTKMAYQKMFDHFIFIVDKRFRLNIYHWP